MKKSVLAVVAILFAVSLTSCLNKYDDTDYVQDWTFMGTVTTGGTNPVFLLDQGYSVAPESTFPADTFAVGERYYLHYILGDTTNHPSNVFPVKVLSYAKAFIKAATELPKDSTDRWEDQPINLVKGWFSGTYCNLFFISFMGVGSPETFEFIRMKQSEKTAPTDTVPKLIFEVRHNVPDISAYYSYFRFISFDLSSLQTEFPNAVRYYIYVRWNEYRSGKVTEPLYYTPNLRFSGPSVDVKAHVSDGWRPTRL
jgi:hypothetical protein